MATFTRAYADSFMASLFVYGVLSGLLVSVVTYGIAIAIRLVRSAPDEI